MQVTSSKAKGFEPFEITIKFESLQEAINIMSLLQCNWLNGPTVKAAQNATVGLSYGTVPNAAQLVTQMNDIYNAFFPVIENYHV